jgi:CspA family cold shock protein
MTTETTRGSVVAWSAEEGWGVIETSRTPGGCWTHFSVLDMTRYRQLHLGREVTVEYEPAAQDGYQWRAVRVTTDGEPQDAPGPRGEAGGDYQSTLNIEWDGDEA